jgi:hypothetical protein
VEIEKEHKDECKLMVLKRKLAYSLSIKNKHMKQSGTQSGLGK